MQLAMHVIAYDAGRYYNRYFPSAVRIRKWTVAYLSKESASGMLRHVEGQIFQIRILWAIPLMVVCTGHLEPYHLATLLLC